MFRNQYDGDVIFWSPQGRIHQIEYAEEAVKQGSATVGLKSKTHAVLVALKRAPSDLSVNQKKILPIDNHVGISIAGLTADARLLSQYMRSECLSNLYNYEEPLAVSRLVAMVGSKSQIRTQRAGGRPFGVGLLVAGYDKKGAHLYQTCPSANYFDCQAMAIGARSQSARTYLERHLEKFENCTLEELVRHGLLALRDTLPNEVDLTIKNCSVGLVGNDTAFTTYEDDHIDQHLKLIEGVARSPGAGKDDDPTPMDEDSDNGGGPGPGPGPGGPGGSGSPPPSDNGMD